VFDNWGTFLFSNCMVRASLYGLYGWSDWWSGVTGDGVDWWMGVTGGWSDWWMEWTVWMTCAFGKLVKSVCFRCVIVAIDVCSAGKSFICSRVVYVLI